MSVFLYFISKLICVVFKNYIPENYEPIPDIIWLNIIKEIIKQLEKKEDILINGNFNNFAISGHTEGNYLDIFRF